MGRCTTSKEAGKRKQISFFQNKTFSRDVLLFALKES